jgi:REP element-mobilizing transposase RayT
MTELDSARTSRHCVFALHTHLVFVTKFRHKVFGDRHLTRPEEIMQAVCADFECELVEFNGEGEHVHLLVNCVGTSRNRTSQPRTRSGLDRPPRAFTPALKGRALAPI